MFVEVGEELFTERAAGSGDGGVAVDVATVLGLAEVDFGGGVVDGHLADARPKLWWKVEEAEGLRVVGQQGGGCSSVSSDLHTWSSAVAALSSSARLDVSADAMVGEVHGSVVVSVR